jgi:hypothetical protein
MAGSIMTPDKVSLQQVIDGLRSEGLLPADADDTVANFIQNLQEVQPWFIRAMVGVGAWLASLLLIGFVASIGFAAKSGFVIVGVLFIGGAILLRIKSRNDFLVQSALATSLAGQAVLAYGIAEVSGNDGKDLFEIMLSIVIVLNVVLFFVFPDRVHRVLSILITATSLGTLVYFWELNVLVPILGPVCAATMMYFYQRQAVFIERGKGQLIRPLVTGLMLAAFGFLLLSTVYLLPELNADFMFYPRPWISTLLLGVLFLYIGTQVWPQLASGMGTQARVIFYGLLLAIIAAAWAIPGLLLALIVTMLGAASGNRMFTGSGIAFLALFIAAYFYGVELSMLTKSIALVTTGATVLLARWLLLRLATGQDEGGPDHA